MSDRMYWVCADVLMLAVQLPGAPQLPPPAELRQRLLTALDAMVGRGRAAGVSDADLAEARYALVAFIDEQILKSNWAGRNEWMGQPLQLLLYQQFTAGENFFVRLRALLQEGRRLDALHAYYLCLVLGFRGAYERSGDHQALAWFLEATRQQLGRGLPSAERLGPRAEPRERVRETRRSSLPLVALVVGAVVVTSGIVFGLERLATSELRAAVEEMPQGSGEDVN
ncbi:MAG: type IVB secretion system protein IcmH/DotU [Pseudomonadota bacterium]